MRYVMVAAALALVSCGPRAEAPQQAADNLCPATAASTWVGDNGATFALEAASTGATCAEASATLTIKDGGGAVVFTETYPASEVMTLAGAESVEDMQRRLGEWIAPGGAAADSTGDLPAWAPGAASPESGDFPFYPEEDLDHDAYEAWRARDAAMFCFVQGMESLACLAMREGALRKIGLQTFPG